MTAFDMGNMPLDEFCDRLKKHPDQDKEVSAELLKEIFPECKIVENRDLIERTDILLRTAGYQTKSIETMATSVELLRDCNNSLNSRIEMLEKRIKLLEDKNEIPEEAP